MDAILQMPMDQVLESVPVDHETRAVLQGRASPLTTFYQLVLAQESGDWHRVNKLARELQIDEVAVAESYWDAVGWAQHVTGPG
jgi:EAL and modified HD-GYP domain-containing signal transduction protein